MKCKLDYDICPSILKQHSQRSVLLHDLWHTHNKWALLKPNKITKKNLELNRAI